MNSFFLLMGKAKHSLNIHNHYSRGFPNKALNFIYFLFSKTQTKKHPRKSPSKVGRASQALAAAPLVTVSTPLAAGWRETQRTACPPPSHPQARRNSQVTPDNLVHSLHLSLYSQGSSVPVYSLCLSESPLPSPNQALD